MAKDLVQEKPKTTDAWGICPACRKERRITDETMVDHRAWNPPLAEMVDCWGSGHEPARVTT